MTDIPGTPSETVPRKPTLRPGIRIGLVLFVVGVAIASACGIAVNALAEDQADLLLIEFVRRCGLLVMLIGMVVVICCLPMAQWAFRRIWAFVDRWSEPVAEPPPFTDRSAVATLPQSRSFSLSALFLGFSAIAVLLGLISLNVQGMENSDDVLETVGGIVATAFAGSFVCWIVFWIGSRSLRASLIGMIAGLIWGGCIAALLALPLEKVQQAVAMTIVGSGMMFVVAVVSRRRRATELARDRAAT